jgi:hypothetical protein
MKIQVVKKATPRAGSDVICPYFVEVPLPEQKKS